MVVRFALLLKQTVILLHFKCLAIGTSGTNFGVISGLFTACPNSQQNYSVTPGTGIASYNWTVPANASVISGQGTNNVTVNFDAGYNSVGNICVSATSTCGVTSALKCKTIVPGTPARPASLSGIMNGLCNALGVNYSTPAVPGITSYNWTVPSGATIVSGNGTNSINVDFSSFTTGQVCVSSTNLCGTSASRCIPVKGAPNTPASITANPSSWCANDAGITFTADVSNVTGGYTLSWAFPPTTTYVSGGGNTTSLTLDWGASNGVVMVTASNACGAGTRTYNAVINCRESSMNADKLQVYPNPTAGMLNVTYTSEKGTTQMSLLDLSGRVIMSQSFNTVAGENTQQLDLSRIAKGAYMLNVQTHSGNHQVKIVVE
ncbi:MAG: T9SS type A sorting domain-containing protein [Bacteroidia bacterium]